MNIRVNLPKNHTSKYKYTDLLLLCDAFVDLITNGEFDEDVCMNFITDDEGNTYVRRTEPRKKPNLRILH